MSDTPVSEARVGDRPGVVLFIQAIVAGLVTAATAAAYAISFAAIIYKGDRLEAFLAPGIGLALLGAAVMGAVGAFFYSYRGTICQPQDITAILLAGSASALAAPGLVADQNLFATVAVFLALTSAATGVLLYLLGLFRVGYLARFVPYPVVAGYMAASGYLLLEAATAFALGEPVDQLSFAKLFDGEVVTKWLPWMGVGLVILLLAKLWDQDLVLPVSLVFVAFGFYLALELTGQTLAAARDQGYLFGPFQEESLIPTFWPALALEADWSAMVSMGPALLAVAGLTVLGTLLSSTGIETTLNDDFDLGKDLRATGLANAVGGAGGGLAGHQLLSETVFANRLGLVSPLAGLSATAGCVLFLFFGGTILELIPLGIFATIITYLGADLLYLWLWRERVKLSGMEYGIVVAIVLVAALYGFIEALVFGMCVAALLFVSSYARSEIVRVRSTAANSRSLVERNDAEVAYLSEVGASAVILQLSGFLFFGTAHRLAHRVGEETDPKNDVDTLILDFGRVYGLDASALFSLTKICQICRRNGVRLVMCGLSDRLSEQFALRPEIQRDAEVIDSLALALEDYEAKALDTPNAPKGGDAYELIEACEAAAAQGRTSNAIDQLTLSPDDVLVEQGAKTREIFLLVEGTIRAELRNQDGPPALVARFQPGALMGEIAYYANLPRTATLVADGDCTVLRIDPEALSMDDPQLAAMLQKYGSANMARRLMRTTRLLYEAGV